jgi:Penicillin binding protein transpeptidase domain
MRTRQLRRLCSIAVLATTSGAKFLHAAAPCDDALSHAMVCEAANRRALEIMKAGNLDAIAVVQDVRTGGLVLYAASDPAKVDVTTALLPLSPVKLLAAASWLDHEKERPSLPDGEQLLSDSIVSGNDNAGRRIASALREAVGTESVLADLARYGFPARRNTIAKTDTKFWAELAPRWRDRLVPASSYHSLGRDTTTKEWEDTLSIGEERIEATALNLSRFLQAVGNGGMMLPAMARDAQPGSTIPATAAGVRVMSETAATKLQTVMRGTVERGTAKNAAPILAGTSWTLGGKTGTAAAPGTTAPGPGSDGCFVGLIFDPQGKARFTVATFVKHGGFGGGNAARIPAELGRFLSGAPEGE